MRPRFSPTGAKRQMGSITALGGHTHTHDFHCYFNKGNTAEGEPNRRRNAKDRKMSTQEKKKIK